MQKTPILSIVAVLGFLILAACNPQIETKKVEVTKVEQERPALILPDVPSFKAKMVRWNAVTPENAQQVFQEIVDAGLQPIMYSVDANGYRNNLENFTELLAIIEKQKVIIAAYENRYN